MPNQGSIEELSLNTIRTLVMDAVQAANSRHPGTPMAMGSILNGLSHCKVRAYGSGFLIFSDYARELATSFSLQCRVV